MRLLSSVSHTNSAILTGLTLRPPTKDPANGGFLLLLGDAVRKVRRLDVAQSIVQEERANRDEL